ncbi:RICIN domain-containing protein [Streptomyces sp. 6N223]|uniref:RICIN domain-containing protein n=1 Tax=Streptomyces sp. 6N223 TaxID=3457412 RepID=UPI003FD2448C
MTEDREVRPELARDVTEFVALLRCLKDDAGLSYRRLEERAARRGEVLARSTIADALRRRSLPRPEVLAAFVRACGVADGEVQAWLDARERLAAAPAPAPGRGPGPATDADPAEPAEPADAADAEEPAGTADPTDSAGPPGSTAAPRRRAEPVHTLRSCRSCKLRLLGSLSIVLLLLTLGVVVVQWGDNEAAGAVGMGDAVAFDNGWFEIRPARTPELCLTEGRERSGRYESAIAAQRLCAEAAPPHTYLRAVGDGYYHIEWQHPDHGRGCLTVLDGGPADDMLEPWDDCSDDRPAQRFRIELADMPPVESYRIRPESSGLCLTVSGGDTHSGAEAIQAPCDEDDQSQRFLIIPTGR